MFKNIGRKIETLAETLFLFGAAVGVITLIWFAVSAVKGNGPASMLFWLLVAALGYALSLFLLTFLLYGFGRLVENSDRMVRRDEDESDTGPVPDEAVKLKYTYDFKGTPERSAETAPIANAPENCIQLNCPGCGRLLNFSVEDLTRKDLLFCPYCGNGFSTFRFRPSTGSKE